ncbi:hypothetical protein ANCCAN_12260 [Ancylostoma caninum]|uniref:Uncharacterized protein n=1 Tax=Ancylostoma caninum TaxID=29170 RepID=A0A368GBJ0_ANCCA|nr:hypothetical protein ANCCAN_12260 [Ancylostoma caninum]
MDQRSNGLSGVLSSSFHSAYFVLLLNVFIAILSAVNCKKKEDTKRKEAGVSAKPITPKAEAAEKETKKSNNGNKDNTPKKKEKQEDTFDEHKPKKEEAKRAKDIKDAKAFNAGDYKTWNKLMKEDDDFEKPLAEKGAGEAVKGAVKPGKGSGLETARAPVGEMPKPAKSSQEKGAEVLKEKSDRQGTATAKENKEENKEGEEKEVKKKEDS